MQKVWKKTKTINNDKMIKSYAINYIRHQLDNDLIFVNFYFKVFSVSMPNGSCWEIKFITYQVYLSVTHCFANSKFSILVWLSANAHPMTNQNAHAPIKVDTGLTLILNSPIVNLIDKHLMSKKITKKTKKTRRLSSTSKLKRSKIFCLKAAREPRI